MRNPYCFAAAALLLAAAVSCTKDDGNKSSMVALPEAVNLDLSTLKGVATMVASLPMGQTHLDEVFGAVGSSSGNGYDEEYTLENLFACPGAGVGDSPAVTKSAPSNAMRDLISEYLEANLPSTKAGRSVEEIITALEESDIQIYWPYSEDWDGKTFPIVTFDPGNGAESNYGYLLGVDGEGNRTVDSVFVNEAVAREHPVWVINRNDDSEYTPLLYTIPSKAAASASVVPISPSPSAPLLPQCPPSGSSSGIVPSVSLSSSEYLSSGPAAAATVNRKLSIKSFEMKRNYDSWFGGASEFWVKCGTVNGFSASTEADLQKYSPSVTDMLIVVKRKDVGKAVPFDAILLTDFTDQLDKLAFLITEDDGGTVTNWKCEATVKVLSKSYGFDISIPFNEKDDIVWRGQLAASFFQSEDEVTGRFGDVVITFALE